MMGEEPYDWADDDSMSAEETMRRFDEIWDKGSTVETTTRSKEFAEIIYSEMIRNGTSSGLIPPWIDRAAERIDRELRA